MSRIYLFDWGDTLMIDLPNEPGHMKDWPKVEEVSGANEVLKTLSLNAKIFVATGAKGTSQTLMQSAFARTRLAPYISGYFCPDNIGYEKPSAEFYKTIANKVGADITMVGDNLERDVLPALSIGMNAIWLNSDNQENTNKVNEIATLMGLIAVH